MENEKEEIRFADLFGGVGGFRLGIEQSGIKAKCVFYCDNDKYAVQTYNKNFKESHKPTDIRTIKTSDIPEIDMLCGGFPCQAFSIAGKRRGFNDTRGTLFFEIARIIKAKRPKIVFLENVKGLLNHNKGETFRTILQTISELGYDVQWMVLNSKFFGVPQNRERVFIIGSLRGTSRPEILPFREIHENNNEESGRQLSSTISQAQRVYGTEGLAPTLKGLGGGQGAKIGLYEVKAVLTPDRAEKRQNGRRFKEDGEPSFTLTGQDVHGVMVAQPAQLVNKNRAKKPYNPNDREMKIKVRDDETSYTVKSATHEFMIKQDMQIRRLTPTECERLQGFPDGWTEGVSDTQRYKQMGNAVTVNVIQAIASKLFALNHDGVGK